MKSEQNKQFRNQTVDIIRGIAMLMVVLGHTISGTCVGYENSFLFRIIWTLQMPLFFIVSGYVTRYSKPLNSASNLGAFLKKRTLAYLLPWLVWTFFVRGLIFGQSNFFDLRFLLWHMDTGYWFLVSLWSIVVIFGVSDWLTNKFSPKNKLKAILLHLLFVAVGMAGLGAIGIVMGMSFLSIKLSLYYIPLFMAGYVYGQLQEKIKKLESSYNLVSVTYALALVIWLAIIIRLNFFNTEMTLWLLAMRYTASICGCIAIIGFITGVYRGGAPCACREIFSRNISTALPLAETATKGISCGFHEYDRFPHNDDRIFVNDCDGVDADICNKDKRVPKQSPVLQGNFTARLFQFLNWAGVNSLAIYLLHGFFLNICLTSDQWLDMKALGVPLLIYNYILCVLLLIPIINLLATNKLLNKILFWK